MLTQIDNLQHDPRDDDIVAGIQDIQVARVAGGCGEPAADGLQRDAAEVDGDEDPGVLPGLEAREGLVEAEDDVLEGQVDAGGEEGGGEDDDDDLGLVGWAVWRKGRYTISRWCFHSKEYVVLGNVLHGLKCMKLRPK